MTSDPDELHRNSAIRRPGSFSKSHPPSRPTTPLRPSSRTSLRDSSSTKRHSSRNAGDPIANPLKDLEPAFAELADGMADLEANFMHLQLMHESLARFTEDFGSLLYGMNVNAFCVDFPETPVPESFKRALNLEPTTQAPRSAETQRFHNADGEPEATFLTTDTSFVENPPISSRSASRFETPAPPRRTTMGAPAQRAAKGVAGTAAAKRGTSAGAGRGTATRGRSASGIARGKLGGAR
ncbi:MAG: DASH complex subunit dam1 [Bathelium mastoideum]|nr:MAG: DASH complex subunit dam1 [Bathelium mastoideum]